MTAIDTVPLQSSPSPFISHSSHPPTSHHWLLFDCYHQISPRTFGAGQLTYLGPTPTQVTFVDIGGVDLYQEQGPLTGVP